jgi:hypothetical protein
MIKKVVATSSMMLIFSAVVLVPSSYGIVLSEKDKRFIEVPFKAYKEWGKLSIPSEHKVRIKVHSSATFDEKSKILYRKGIENLLNKFSGIYDKDDNFHIVFASNYSDAERLIEELNSELPNYAEYNKRHLSIAKENLMEGKNSFSGGTSSRGCFFQGSKYGDQGNSVNACPDLQGGVIYFFHPNPSIISWTERVGAHEAFHLIMSKVNPMSHYRVPDWIIEGTIEGISFAQVTNSQNYKMPNHFFNPTPIWRPSIVGQPYDLSKFEYQNGGDDRFSIGFLATSLLVSEVGIDKYFKFISTTGYPKDWKNDFRTEFGFNVDDFYQKFREYHSWYFYEGGFEKIQQQVYFASERPKFKSSSIICHKGKTTKKITGVVPKCPAGFKKR